MRNYFDACIKWLNSHSVILFNSFSHSVQLIQSLTHSFTQSVIQSVSQLVSQSVSQSFMKIKTSQDNTTQEQMQIQNQCHSCLQSMYWSDCLQSLYLSDCLQSMHVFELWFVLRNECQGRKEGRKEGISRLAMILVCIPTLRDG
jgi:hypothetical protein